MLATDRTRMRDRSQDRDGHAFFSSWRRCQTPSCCTCASMWCASPRLRCCRCKALRLRQWHVHERVSWSEPQQGRTAHRWKLVRLLCSAGADATAEPGWRRTDCAAVMAERGRRLIGRRTAAAVWAMCCGCGWPQTRSTSAMWTLLLERRSDEGDSQRKENYCCTWRRRLRPPPQWRRSKISLCRWGAGGNQSPRRRAASTTAAERGEIRAQDRFVMQSPLCRVVPHPARDRRSRCAEATAESREHHHSGLACRSHWNECRPRKRTRWRWASCTADESPRRRVTKN